MSRPPERRPYTAARQRGSSFRRPRAPRRARTDLGHRRRGSRPRAADPLGPGNVLVYRGGLFAGTSVPNGGRLSVGGKSPLTGGIKEANSGGSAARDAGRPGSARASRSPGARRSCRSSSSRRTPSQIKCGARARGPGFVRHRRACCGSSTATRSRSSASGPAGSWSARRPPSSSRRRTTTCARPPAAAWAP